MKAKKMNSEDAKTGSVEQSVEGLGESGDGLFSFFFAPSRLRCSPC